MNVKIVLLATVFMLSPAISKPGIISFLKVTTSDLKPEGGDGHAYVNLRFIKNVDGGVYKASNLIFFDDFELECDERPGDIVRTINRLGACNPVSFVRLSALNGSFAYVNVNNVVMFYKNRSGVAVWFSNGKYVNCSDSVNEVVEQVRYPIGYRQH